MPRIHIGAWQVDGSDGTVTAEGRVTRLEPKVMAVLLALAEQPGALVPQEALLREVWADTCVGPGALARAISVLRRALGDDARDPRYIETVPKRGYRLIASVREAAPRSLTEASAVAPRPPGSRRWRSFALLAAAAALVVLTSRDAPKTPPARVHVGAPQFDHQSRAGNENAFAHYRRAVALDPSSAVAHAGLATAYAFRANYLPDRGRWVARAVEAATLATQLDPGCPFAARALGTAYIQAGQVRRAEAQYRRSLDLSPLDDATRTNLGRVLLSSGRVAEALSLFEQHIAAAPESVAGYAHLTNGLVVAGYPREAAEVAQAALALEAYAFEPQMVLVRMELIDGRYDAARARLERLLEVRPDCVQCVVQLGLIDQLTNRPARAEARYRAARAMSPPFPAATLRLAHVHARAGRRAEADALLSEVEGAARHAVAHGAEGYYPRWQMAVVESLRGDRAAAVEWYGQAVATGRRDATWDAWDPLFATVQPARDFAALHQPFRAEHDAAASIARRWASSLGAVDRRLRRFNLLPLVPDPPGWPSGR